MSKKEIKYPNIGIYVVYHDGGKFIKNQHFKNEGSKQGIIRRMIKHKATNEQKVKLMILYLNHSKYEGSVIYRDPRSFRLWLKFSPENYHLAKRKEGGITVIERPTPNVDNDFFSLETLVQKAWVQIKKGTIWQAKIYDPQNEIVFDWSNLEGEKGTNLLEFTEAVAT